MNNSMSNKKNKGAALVIASNQRANQMLSILNINLLENGLGLYFLTILLSSDILLHIYIIDIRWLKAL